METEISRTLDLVITREISAPVELVWLAWTEPKFLKKWWGPHGFTCPVAQIDFREGKTSLVCMSSPEFGDLYSIWRYREIIPMKQFEYVHNMADKDGNIIDPVSIGMPPDFPVDMVNIVALEDLGNNRTKLTITECDWTKGQMMEMSRLGMEQCLDKLESIFTL